MSKKKKKKKKEDVLSYTVVTNVSIPNKYGYMKCFVGESKFIDSYDDASIFSDNVYGMFKNVGCGIFRGILANNKIWEFTQKERETHEKVRKKLETNY